MKRNWLLALAVLLLTGCIQIDKRVIVYNLAPCTMTRIDVKSESTTDVPSSAQADANISLIPK